MKREDDNDAADEDGWAFGDIWKKGSPEAPEDDSNVQYVDILRGDTGSGYDDSLLLELIGFLSSRGIRATYDSVPLAAEFGGAIKTYVLKVEMGREDDARTALREKFNERR